jgi:hypothetical protein
MAHIYISYIINQCMTDNNNNVAACDFYYKALQQCQSSNP